MDIGGTQVGFGDVALLAVAGFLLAGVYSFVRQGIKIGALILLVIAGLVVVWGLR